MSPKDLREFSEIEKMQGESDFKITNKYDRVIKGKDGNTCIADVYDILKAFDVVCPALQHLTKKALCSGFRGHKNKEEDLQDIIDSAIRAKELFNENK